MPLHPRKQSCSWCGFIFSADNSPQLQHLPVIQCFLELDGHNLPFGDASVDPRFRPSEETRRLSPLVFQCRYRIRCRSCDRKSSLTTVTQASPPPVARLNRPLKGQGSAICIAVEPARCSSLNSFQPPLKRGVHPIVKSLQLRRPHSPNKKEP